MKLAFKLLLLLHVPLSFIHIVLVVNDVANGLQPWKILDDSNNHIDLVLMEVVMPILFGIGLLCKLMRHKSIKNIQDISKYRF